MNTFLKYLPFFLLALVLDGIDILLFIIGGLSLPSVIGPILTVLLNIVQIIFGILFWLLLFIFGMLSEFKGTRTMFLRMSRIIISVVGLFVEEVPVVNDFVGFLPMRFLAVLFMFIEESGILEKIEERIKPALQKIPLPGISALSSLAPKFLPSLIEKQEKFLPQVKSLASSPQLPNKTALVSQRKIPQEDTSPKKIRPKYASASIILIFLLLPFFVSAQTNRVLFYAERLQNSRVLITAIFVNPQRRIIINEIKNAYYTWELTGTEQRFTQTSKPIVITTLSPNYSNQEINIKLTLHLPNLKKEVYYGKVRLNSPDVAIIRKVKNYFELPFIGTYEPGETIQARPYNFSSNNLSFVWYINDIYLSNSPSINSSLLRTGYLILKVKNLDNIFESASEFLIVK